VTVSYVVTVSFIGGGTNIFGYEKKRKMLHLEMSKITVIFQDKKKK